MERKVTLKQHVWDQTFTDKNSAAVRILGLQSNTLQQKDFKIEAIMELSVPAEPPFKPEAVRITKTIPGDAMAAFQDAARAILQVIQLRNASPWPASRKYTEFSSPFVEGITVGAFKPIDEPSSYFLELATGNGPCRFIIGDQDQLEEFRYIFRELSSFHEAICQQRGAQVA
jgi:hypothetical protein